MIQRKLPSLSAWFTTVLCVAGLACMVWQGVYADPQAGMRYADTHKAIITAADGFYYLAHAVQPTAGAPPLSQLTALITQWTGWSLYSVAFWLPCVFAIGMACWYAGWARLLGFSTGAAILAAAGASLVPAWIERSRPGWFDTDPAIAFLWHGTLWATACLALTQGAQRWQALFTALLCGGLLAWWWPPGAVLLPACVLLFGVSFLWCPNKKEAHIRLAVLILALAGGLCLLFLPDTLLPHIVHQMRGYAVDHLYLILGLKKELIFASIAELEPVKVEHYLRALGGGLAGGVLVLAALPLFGGTYPAALWFLLPSLGMLLLGCMGERFIYLGALPLGLALGALPHTLGQVIHTSTPRWKKTANLLGLVLACGALANMLYWAATWTPDGHFRTEHDRIAVALRRASPSGAPVWNWWDDGYFLRARTGLVPLFDGGSQSPLVAWIAARPLTHSDPRFARRWIRFFALRGVHALHPLTIQWGGEAKAWEILEQVFAADIPEEQLRTLPPLHTSAGDVQEWLFPQGRVFLYLSHRVLRLSQWWMPLGTDRHAKRSAVYTHIDALSAQGLAYDPATGILTLPESVIQKGYTQLHEAFLTDIQPLDAPWPEDGGIYLVASLQSPWLYMTTGQGLRSLPLRLLAPGGKLLEGFAPIAVDYGAAGAWEVLP